MCKWFPKIKKEVPVVPAPVVVVPVVAPEVDPDTLLPTSSARITISELRALIKAKFSGCTIHLSDKDYLLCSYDDIALFLAQDDTNKMTYVSQKRDCDDFSYRLMGQFSIEGWSDLCFGIIWTKTHAFNCFVTEDRELLFIEPQSDAIATELIGTSDEAKMIVI